MALTVMAGVVNAGSFTLDLPAPNQPATLHAFVTAGMTSTCGLREAPHLIEHLLLSDTRYGDSPVDAMLALKDEGITLKAVTLLDYTHYSLTGPAAKADQMGEALAEFLGRSSLPIMGFEREKNAILSELRQSSHYISQGSFFERFVADYANGPTACSADSKPLTSYHHSEIDELYRQLYAADSIFLAGVGLPGVFDLEGLRQRIIQGKADNKSVNLSAVPMKQRDLLMVSPPGVTEILFPIQGRSHLPYDAAQAIAERMRLEIQAFLRRELGLYSARSFVDQGFSGGWIRLEIPGLPQELGDEIARIAEIAAQRISLDDYGDDALWRLFNNGTSPEAPARHFVAAQSPERVNWWRRIASKLLNMLGF